SGRRAAGDGGRFAGRPRNPRGGPVGAPLARATAGGGLPREAFRPQWRRALGAGCWNSRPARHSGSDAVAPGSRTELLLDRQGADAARKAAPRTLLLHAAPLIRRRLANATAATIAPTAAEIRAQPGTNGGSRRAMPPVESPRSTKGAQ